MDRTILIVGGGSAGLPAAIEAAARGARAVVLEGSNQLGGTLLWSGASIAAAGARLQRAKGIADSVESHVNDVLTTGRGRSDRALLDLATRDLAATVDWLEDAGLAFTESSPGFAHEHELYSVPRTHWPVRPEGKRGGHALLATFEHLMAGYIAAGRIEICLNCRVTGLIQRDGRVVGVRVGDREIFGDAIILATGGYAGNMALVAELHPRLAGLISMARPTSAGDGLLMARDLGADLRNMDILVPMPGYLEDPANPGFTRPLISVPFVRPAATAGDIWVNADGERFMREDETSPDARERALLTQRPPLFHAIFDQPMRLGLTPTVGERTALVADAIVTAPTLADLAAAIDVPAANLEATVARYNARAAEGADRDFGRAVLAKAIDMPPFSALTSKGAAILTSGGVSVNDRLQVLRGGEPVAGLYAVGEVIGLAALMGDGFASGLSVGPGIIFAKRAVRHALGAA